MERDCALADPYLHTAFHQLKNLKLPVPVGRDTASENVADISGVCEQGKERMLKQLQLLALLVHLDGGSAVDHNVPPLEESDVVLIDSGN